MNARPSIQPRPLSAADELVIVLIEQLCLGWHQSVVRGAAVGLLETTLPKLSRGNTDLDEVRVAARMMANADNALDWAYACNEAQRAIMPLLRARTNALIIDILAEERRMPQ